MPEVRSKHLLLGNKKNAKMQIAVAHTMVAKHGLGKMYAAGGLCAQRKIMIICSPRLPFS